MKISHVLYNLFLTFALLFIYCFSAIGIELLEDLKRINHFDAGFLRIVLIIIQWFLIEVLEIISFYKELYQKGIDFGSDDDDYEGYDNDPFGKI